MNPPRSGARQEIEKKQFLLERKRKALDAQIAALQLELETDEQESPPAHRTGRTETQKWQHDRGDMAKSRSAVAAAPAGRATRAKERGVRK